MKVGDFHNERCKRLPESYLIAAPAAHRQMVHSGLRTVWLLSQRLPSKPAVSAPTPDRKQRRRDGWNLCWRARLRAFPRSQVSPGETTLSKPGLRGAVTAVHSSQRSHDQQPQEHSPSTGHRLGPLQVSTPGPRARCPLRATELGTEHCSRKAPRGSAQVSLAALLPASLPGAWPTWWTHALALPLAGDLAPGTPPPRVTL